jgi:chaperonin cofactor prefoldin
MFLRSKFKREARRSLEKELQNLSSHRDSLDITDESLDKRINDIEKELEQIYNQKAKGAQIRSIYVIVYLIVNIFINQIINQ